MFKHLSLYKQLVLLIGMLSIVLLMVFGLMAYHYAAGIVTEQVTQNSQTVLEQMNFVSEQWINSMELFSLSVTTDSQIESALKELKRTHGLDQVGAVNTITDRILFHTASQPDIVRVSLICPYAELASYYKMWNTYYILDSSSLQTEQWQEYLNRRSFGVVPLSLKDEVYSNLPEQNYITFYRNLSVFSNVDDNESILLITLPEKILGSMLVAQGDAGDVYFTINENNIPISYGMQEDVVRHFLEENADLFSEVDHAAGFQDRMFEHERYAVIYSSVNRYGLRTIQLKPYKELLEPLSALMKRIGVVGAFCLLAVFPAIIWFSKKVLDPLNMLIEQMQRVGKGDFEISQMSHYTNEIGQINSHFLQMVNEIREMLKRVERISNEKAEIEFQVLQQQINPHFLYNTLDFINWMAIRAHADDISKAVVRLSEFFRLSLSNGVSLLTIDEELQRIAAYMDIQNLILKGRIQYSEEVLPEVKKQHIIRLILQPFIENSILHGFPDGENGKICISGWLDGNDIYLQISDNGRGIPEMEQELILHEPSSRYGKYGVYNVNKRLQLYYGPEYGVKYLPVRKGTTVLVHIPGKEEV